MTDIVERLRFKKELKTPEDVHVLFADAADEIERLRGVFNKMADALTNKKLTDWQILEEIESLTRAELWR